MDGVMSESGELVSGYERIKAKAIDIAGASGDIPRRVTALHSIYLSSHGNHAFPQVALHGALWASGFLEVTGTLGKLISYRYAYSGKERALRLGMLNAFSEGFKDANRSVFIDTYTNYHFSKEFGKHRDAHTIMMPELLEALNETHAASASGQTLSERAKRRVFEASLLWEQEKTVAPRVEEEVRKFTCPVLTSLVLRPIVRFRYFPRVRYLLFRDFSNEQERIDKAMLSYDLAVRAGWPRVITSMQEYPATKSMAR